MSVLEGLAQLDKLLGGVLLCWYHTGPPPSCTRGIMFKTCTKCKIEQSIDMFGKRKERPSGYRSYCKTCQSVMNKEYASKAGPRKGPERDAAYKRYYETHKHKFYVQRAKRRASEKLAVPPWAEHDLIKTLYAKAMELGFEVDHIVPLNSDIVCGLHCWHNLQLLDMSINRSKGNREWPDMPLGSL